MAVYGVRSSYAGASMTQDGSFHNSPSKVVKARKKFLLMKQKLTKDAVELEMIDRQMQEVEYLLTRYSDPTTRRKIERKDEHLPDETPIEILEARHNNILLQIQRSADSVDELYKTEKQLEKVQTLLSKYVEPKTQRIKKK
jgi:hypothetical protein